ncbi:MAG: hypothetical protein U1A78_35215 [Polyangia bacterium]
MDAHDGTRRPLPPLADSSRPGAPPALLALGHAPLDPGGPPRPRGPGWRLALALILLVGIGTAGALLATRGPQPLQFTNSVEDY